MRQAKHILLLAMLTMLQVAQTTLQTVRTKRQAAIRIKRQVILTIPLETQLTPRIKRQVTPTAHPVTQTPHTMHPPTLTTLQPKPKLPPPHTVPQLKDTVRHRKLTVGHRTIQIQIPQVVQSQVRLVDQ